ncbi:MAG TPA: hypothetical protein PK014_00205 [Thermoanaerobaculia bacterium]|nr:hypothetical protein [Thermoanaerobaculia bacterium]HXK66893.1 hypothetical protein [Thermoanaerobaculia bacterium]
MNHRQFLIIIVITLAAAAAFASFPATESFLPAAGTGPGAMGSYWSTTVWVYNPGSTDAVVTFALLAREQENPGPLTFTDTISAGKTRRYEDAIVTMFGIDGFGALRITSTEPVLVNSRIYSTPSGGTERDSAGQFFSAVPASFAIGQGETSDLLGVHQTSPKTDSLFRYNVGLVETTGAPVTVKLTFLSPQGLPIHETYADIGVFQPRQFAAEELFPAIDGDNFRIRAEVVSGNGKVLLYGSGLANQSNDPSTFEMRFKDDLLAENASTGSITGVTAGNGLTGGGSTGDVTLHVGGGTGIQVGADAISIAVPLELSGGGTHTIRASNVDGAGIAGFSQSTSGMGVMGHNDVSGDEGRLGGYDYGVYGFSQSERGVFGSSPAGVGVFGVHSASNNQGGLGASTAGAVGIGYNGYGVMGQSVNSAGVFAQSDNSYALVAGSSSSISIFGVSGGGSGYSPANPVDLRAAVWGDSGVSAGVMGTSSQAYGNGVRAIALGQGGRGLQASAEGDNGVAVYAIGAGTNASAGYFVGNVNVTGSLSKGGGSFKIDYPDDPLNFYLYHSFVESPDMMNIYNGNITTDQSGEAVVTLPDYFDSLNRDFRYQLTVLGSFAHAVVWHEIEGNTFVIRTDRPFTKVSWQVTGIRKDPWAEAHRIPVREEKPVEERGRYLHPEAYGIVTQP